MTTEEDFQKALDAAPDCGDNLWTWYVLTPSGWIDFETCREAEDAVAHH